MSSKPALKDFIPFERYSRRIAVIEQSAYRTRKYSYREIEDGALRAAAGLRRRGVIAGDRVLLWGESSARWVMTFYACLLQGCVVVPIDAGFSGEFVRKVQSITGAKLVCSNSDPEAWEDLFAQEAGGINGAVPEDSSLLEIIFTSGTTGDPKGVMITHGNVLANLVPIRKEYEKYSKYASLFAPFGFVHLIPLSHLFGQVMGLFIPQMLGGCVIFTEPAAPRVIEAVRKNRASVVVCVPQELGMLHKYIARKSEPAPVAGGWLRKWWAHRDIHGEFGWKFWAFVVGGASLPQEEETFWGDLGYAVIQGYGLTETAPAIAITHPFKGIRKGAVGKKLPGVEVKIAGDGEILVRGGNVTPGYYENEAATREAFEDGWLRTGDLGQFDEQGNLRLLGRKKEVIVTSEGLNVFPQDVESVLNADSRVKECAVVAREASGRAEVHAVFVLQDGVTQDHLQDIVGKGNDRLESFQRVQSWSLWPERELPRTTTGKLKRVAIARGAVGVPAQQQSLAERLLSGKAEAGEALELSSLDRVELMVELEEGAGVEIDDAAFARARTAGEIAGLMSKAPAEKADHYPAWEWPRWWPCRAIRFASMYLLVFPALRLYARVEAEGLQHLAAADPPVLFVSNHQSLLDVPVLLRALPFRWRHRLAPAMGPREKTRQMYEGGLFFNAYPLPGTSVGLREALQHTGRLADCGYSPLVFPEGARTRDGRVQAFRSGIGVIAKQTGLTVVPVRISGAFEIWPIHQWSPLRSGKPIRVRFGPPLRFAGKEPAAIVAELQSSYQEDPLVVQHCGSGEERPR